MNASYSWNGSFACGGGPSSRVLKNPPSQRQAAAGQIEIDKQFFVDKCFCLVTEAAGLAAGASLRADRFDASSNKPERKGDAFKGIQSTL
jgi:hypothetical protein